ncbi:MAG: extracellular solute-binding protein [Spirochaetales bacterium]|nr:extracellular solute-binding protein [Spirochaetales bacterium]
MKRAIAAFALAIALALPLVAQSFDPRKKYEVTFGVYGDLERAYREVLSGPDFKSKYPNITFKFQTADMNGHHNRLATIIAAGEAANDIEAVEIRFISNLVESGGLTDLGAKPFNGRVVGKDLVKFAMSNATTTRGKLVAMPVDIAPAVLFYRKDLADAAKVNLDSLKSWDEYIEAGKKLTLDRDGDGKKDQFAITHPGDVGVIPLNGGNGGWFEDGKPLEPKQKFLDVLDLVLKIRRAGIDADLGAWTPAWTQALKDGKVATMPLGSWFGGALKTWIAPESKGKWRVAYLPGKLYAAVGGTYLAIPAKVSAARKAAAWEVIKYLATSPVAQLAVFRSIDAFPALTTVYSDKVMDEGVEYFGGQKVRKIYADVALHIPESPVSEYDNVVLSIWMRAVSTVVFGKKSPEVLYEEARKKILATVE